MGQGTSNGMHVVQLWGTQNRVKKSGEQSERGDAKHIPKDWSYIRGKYLIPDKKEARRGERSLKVSPHISVPSTLSNKRRGYKL